MAPKDSFKPYGFLWALKLLEAAAYDTRLGSTTVAVLVILMGYINPRTYSCYPSISNIARKKGVSRQAISAHIRILKNEGYIDVISKIGKPNIYRFKNAPNSKPPPQLTGCASPQSMSCTTPQPPAFVKKPYKIQIQEIAGNQAKLSIDQNAYYQAKQRELETGVSAHDEQKMAEALQNAYGHLTPLKRASVYKKLESEAKAAFSDKKEQHTHIRKALEEIQKENHLGTVDSRVTAKTD